MGQSRPVTSVSPPGAPAMSSPAPSAGCSPRESIRCGPRSSAAGCTAGPARSAARSTPPPCLRASFPPCSPMPGTTWRNRETNEPAANLDHRRDLREPVGRRHRSGRRSARRAAFSPVMWCSSRVISRPARRPWCAALVRALGGDATDVSSPTFVLLQSYHCNRGFVATLHHVDLYRLGEKISDLREIGIEEVLSDPAAVVAVEWPKDVLATWIPADARVWRVDHHHRRRRREAHRGRGARVADIRTAKTRRRQDIAHEAIANVANRTRMNADSADQHGSGPVPTSAPSF